MEHTSNSTGIDTYTNNLGPYILHKLKYTAVPHEIGH